MSGKSLNARALPFNAGGRRVRFALAALLASVAPMAIAAWPQVAHAQNEVITFDIPVQSVAPALVEFARQAGVRLSMSEEPWGGVQANAVHGAMGREQALELLLRGTGYQGRIEGGSIRLIRESDDGQQQLWETRHGSEQSSSVNGRNLNEDDPLDEDAIVVIGTNIRGARVSSLPIEVYSAEEIERSGAITTEQFIQRLPQNLGSRTQYAAAGTSGSPSTANRESVNGVDLRGLGVGTTLVLLNGRRMGLASNGQAADVSIIPASSLARIEVLTDGASAIYGSDAIGGVVNFVLRDDVDGQETRIRYGGVTEGELRQGGVTQSVGRTWSSGHGLFALDYQSASALSTLDRSFSQAAGLGDLTPIDQRSSLLGTLAQDITSNITLTVDVALAERQVKHSASDLTAANPLLHVETTFRSQTAQRFINLGFDARLGSRLSGSILATYSAVDTGSDAISIFPALNLQTRTNYDSEYAAIDLTGLVSGRLFELPGGAVQFSTGIGALTEEYQASRAAIGSVSGRNLARVTQYAFGELSVPVAAPHLALPLLHRVELSLAARYTNYEDQSAPKLGREFGDNVSPKIGFLWSPHQALALRLSYGESFRAPSLTQIDASSAVNNLLALSVGGQPSVVLRLVGPSPDLEPETAETFTWGFDFAPSHLPGVAVSGTYFNIDYTDRIASADPTGGLAPRADPSSFPEVIYQVQSAALVEALLSSTRNTANNTGISLADLSLAAAALVGMPNFWVLDSRFKNLSISTVEGFDISARFATDVDVGRILIGAQITKVLRYNQQLSPGAPVLSVVDTVLLPVGLRGRAYVGYARDAFSATLNINYVDEYSNPYAQGGGQRVESWTTIDLNASYDFSRWRGPWRGLRASLSVQNLFNEPPPYVEISTGEALRNNIGFDPANANPLGRFLQLGLIKTW